MLKNFLFLIICFGLTLNTFGQVYSRSQLTELQQQLKEKEGTEKIRILLDLSEAYYYFQLDTSLAYAEEAGLLSLNYRYDWGKYKSLYHYTKATMENNAFDEVPLIIKSTRKWFEINKYDSDALYCDVLYTRYLRYTKGHKRALLQSLENLKVAKELKNNRLLGLIWLNKSSLESLNKRQNLDTSRYYLSLANDSANILLSLLNQTELGSNYGSFKTADTIKQLLSVSSRWGNTKLINITNLFFLTHCINSVQHDSIATLIDATQEKVKHYNSLRAKIEMRLRFFDVYRRTNSTEKSLEQATIAFNLSSKSKFSMSKIETLLRLINYYSNNGDYASAIRLSLRVVELLKQLDDAYRLLKLKTNLGALYTFTNDLEKAEDILVKNKSEIKLIEDGAKKSAMKNTNSFFLGQVYLEQERYEEARIEIRASIKAFNQSSLAVIIGESLILKSYVDQKEIGLATLQYQDIIERFGIKMFHRVSAMNYLLEGRLFLLQGRRHKAIVAGHQFLERTNNELSDLNNKITYELLYNANKELNNHEEALLALEKYKEIEDRIESKNTNENLSEIESDYKVSLKEAVIDNLEKQHEITHLELDQREKDLELRKSYNLILSIGILLIIILGYGLFRRYRLKKEREKAEMKTRRIRLELENVEAKQKAELAEVKNTLFANVSHEFRTPLTLIKVPVQSYIEKIPEEDRPIFKGVLSNTNQLLTMVDELLELAKMEAGDIELNISVFNLSNFFTQIKSNFKPLFREKNIELVWQNSIGLSQFEGDENRLKIVLNNLLNNAYNHTPEKGQVICKIEPSGNGALKIVISNTGSSISDRDLPYIFDRYYRGNEKNYVGNGIGLSLCKQITEMHSGTIRVNNNLDNAVAFEVELPGLIAFEESKTRVKENTKIISVEEVEPIVHSERTQELPKILVVEDNAEMRVLIDSVLKDHFRLDFAENGEAGEQKAIKNQPDLVLSDIMMPKKDGFELLKTLKTNLTTSHIPVILLTAKADAESRITGLDQDADDYIAKPFEADVLRARISNILRQRHQLQELFNRNPYVFDKKAKYPDLDARFLEKASEILVAKYKDGDFSVDGFCKELALNRNSVHNKIKTYTGQSTAEYIRNYRLKKATEMLLTSNAVIGEICLNVGFNSSQAFNKAFKERYSLTPTEYRNQNQ